MVAAAAAAFAGGAYASTKDPGGSSRQAFVNDVAKRLHVTPTQLDSALKGAAIDELSAAVKEGRITQAQANQLMQRIQKAGAPAPLPGPRMGAGGPGIAGGPFGRPRFGGHRIIHAGMDAAAKYLGLTAAQLRKQLESGKSLADIAKAHHKSTSGLESALTAAVNNRLDKLVANKRITAAREQMILSRVSARIKDLINVTPPAEGKLGFGRPGFGYHGFGGRFRRGEVPTPKPGAKGGPAAFPATAPPPAGLIA